jgi:hypothetical protein
LRRLEPRLRRPIPHRAPPRRNAESSPPDPPKRGPDARSDPDAGASGHSDSVVVAMAADRVPEAAEDHAEPTWGRPAHPNLGGSRRDRPVPDAAASMGPINIQRLEMSGHRPLAPATKSRGTLRGASSEASVGVPVTAANCRPAGAGAVEPGSDSVSHGLADPQPIRPIAYAESGVSSA